MTGFLLLDVFLTLILILTLDTQCTETLALRMGGRIWWEVVMVGDR